MAMKRRAYFVENVCISSDSTYLRTYCDDPGARVWIECVRGYRSYCGCAVDLYAGREACTVGVLT